MRDRPDVPSLSLGSGVVTPLELTTAFAAFPNGGYAVRPRAIVRTIEGLLSGLGRKLTGIFR